MANPFRTSSPNGHGEPQWPPDSTQVAGSQTSRTIHTPNGAHNPFTIIRPYLCSPTTPNYNYLTRTIVVACRRSVRSLSGHQEGVISFKLFSIYIIPGFQIQQTDLLGWTYGFRLRTLFVTVMRPINVRFDCKPHYTHGTFSQEAHRHMRIYVIRTSNL